MRRVLPILILIIMLICANVYKAETSVYASTNECTHAWVWKIDVAPLCMENGMCHQECKHCGLTRNLHTEIPPIGKHNYENACDTNCNICEAKRKVTGHSYKNECDSTCEICGEKRYVDGHKYATNCDNKCIYCGYIRKKVDHKYTNICDTTCNNCGRARKITHNYTNVITKATRSQNGKVVRKCKVCRRVAYTNTIYRAKIVKLNKTNYSYTGKAIEPTLVVKNSKGSKISSKYYTVKYSKGRKSIGTYKITVTFKDRYQGKKVLTFKITPKNTAITTLKAGDNSFTVKYKKQTTGKGYQIQYSKSKKFTNAKTVKVTHNKTLTKTIKNLNSKKTYYVRVRTYKKIGDKTYYANWSKAKKVKTK